MKDTKTTRRLFLRKGLIWTLGAPLVVGTLATEAKAAPSIYSMSPQSCNEDEGNFVIDVFATGIESSYFPIITWDGQQIGSLLESAEHISGWVSESLVQQPGTYAIRVEYLYSSEVSDAWTFYVN